MRFYGFGNYYLSSLQQGLQAGHTIAELFVDFGRYGNQSANKFANQQENVHHLIRGQMVFDWAKNHKTMVLLNGGNSKDLAELFEFFASPENKFPFAKFNEDEQSLCNALTYVGIILPERIYDSAAAIRRGNYIYDAETQMLSIQNNDPNLGLQSSNTLTSWEFGLCEKLNQYGLAK